MIRRQKRTIWSIVCFTLLACFFFGAPYKSEAQQVSSVESESSIAFTGIYEPIGTPDPKPPENIVKPPETSRPEGSLPQTNDRGTLWFSWLGILILIFVFITKKRKNNKKTNL